MKTSIIALLLLTTGLAQAANISFNLDNASAAIESGEPRIGHAGFVSADTNRYDLCHSLRNASAPCAEIAFTMAKVKIRRGDSFME